MARLKASYSALGGQFSEQDKLWRLAARASVAKSLETQRVRHKVKLKRKHEVEWDRGFNQGFAAGKQAKQDESQR